MNQYRIILEVNEKFYRKLEKAEVKLKLKGQKKNIFVPFSKRQIKYNVEHYLQMK